MRNTFSRILLLLGVITIMAIMVPSVIHAVQPTHLDPFKVKYTCAGCHSGHGKKGTPMLRNDVPLLCFTCHGPEGYSYYNTSTEVYFEFQKRYRHPVEETARYHRQSELLPETDISVTRHVSCLDCHNPHASTPDDPIKGVPGVSPQRNRQKPATDVNDICFKCHSDNLNMPADKPNVREEFDTSNPSYHPVLGVAKGRSESLKPGMEGKLITCTDCHTPHGSDNKYMLRYTYLTGSVPESPGAYELCYNCHDRQNILGDHSFREHKRHILFESTSCRTCHIAHGSREYDRLIEFDTSVVMPNSEGILMYEHTGSDNKCYLSCHKADHRGNVVEVIK